MLNQKEILSTIEMIDQQHLDIRTITMGISLLSCCDPDPKRACEKIYDKITRYAEKLVKTGEDIDSRLVLHRRPAPHGGDPAVAHQQGLGIRAVPLQSADGAVFKENVHAIPPFLPVYRGRARPIPRRETPSIGQYAAKRREPCCT